MNRNYGVGRILYSIWWVFRHGPPTLVRWLLSNPSRSVAVLWLGGLGTFVALTITQYTGIRYAEKERARAVREAALKAQAEALVEADLSGKPLPVPVPDAGVPATKLAAGKAAAAPANDPSGGGGRAETITLMDIDEMEKARGGSDKLTKEAIAGLDETYEGEDGGADDDPDGGTTTLTAGGDKPGEGVNVVMKKGGIAGWISRNQKYRKRHTDNETLAVLAEVHGGKGTKVAVNANSPLGGLAAIAAARGSAAAEEEETGEKVEAVETVLPEGADPTKAKPGAHHAPGKPAPPGDATAAAKPGAPAAPGSETAAPAGPGGGDTTTASATHDGKRGHDGKGSTAAAAAAAVAANANAGAPAAAPAGASSASGAGASAAGTAGAGATGASASAGATKPAAADTGAAPQPAIHDVGQAFALALAPTAASTAGTRTPAGAPHAAATTESGAARAGATTESGTARAGATTESGAARAGATTESAGAAHAAGTRTPAGASRAATTGGSPGAPRAGTPAGATPRAAPAPVAAAPESASGDGDFDFRSLGLAIVIAMSDSLTGGSSEGIAALRARLQPLALEKSIALVTGDGRLAVNLPVAVFFDDGPTTLPNARGREVLRRIASILAGTPGGRFEVTPSALPPPGQAGIAAAARAVARSVSTARAVEVARLLTVGGIDPKRVAALTAPAAAAAAARAAGAPPGSAAPDGPEAPERRIEIAFVPDVHPAQPRSPTQPPGR